MCKSPRAKTSTILNNQKLKVDLENLQKQCIAHKQKNND